MANDDIMKLLEDLLSDVRDIQDQMENVLEHITLLNHRVNDLAERVKALEGENEPGPN